MAIGPAQSTASAESNESTHVAQEKGTALPTLVREDSYLDEDHVQLSWRSWSVVFVCCFAICAQVYVVSAAGSVIAFIIRDIGSPALAGWVIQGPLLIQSVLSPSFGRLSDVLDRKWLASMPPLVAFVGAVISARAQNMNTLIGGGILIGVTLPTSAIIQAIPSELLPLKYRSIANGLAFVGGSIGSLLGTICAGAVTSQGVSGWRTLYWIMAGFHLMTTVGFLVFYRPTHKTDYPKMNAKDFIWSLDPIGSILFIAGSTLTLLALNWASGTYSWSNPHVAANLAIGLATLVAFGLYEWKGRTDGLVAHALFHRNANFPLAAFAFAVEGWIFYSAVNSITPQIVLNLGWETSSLDISVRQLSFNLVCLFTSGIVMWYSTKYKDLKSPLVVTFGLFLIATICYATLKPSYDKAQYGLNVIVGIGQSGPLTLLVALCQFASPHAFLSTATGLAFSIRAIGGTFGSAILGLIISAKLTNYASAVGGAAVKAGLPSSSVADLLTGMADGSPALISAVPGITTANLAAAVDASHHQYAKAYAVAWASIIPFVVIALVAVICTSSVKEMMTDHVEATVEKRPLTEKGEEA